MFLCNIPPSTKAKEEREKTQGVDIQHLYLIWHTATIFIFSFHHNTEENNRVSYEFAWALLNFFFGSISCNNDRVRIRLDKTFSIYLLGLPKSKLFRVSLEFFQKIGTLRSWIMDIIDFHILCFYYYINE